LLQAFCASFQTRANGNTSGGIGENFRQNRSIVLPKWFCHQNFQNLILDLSAGAGLGRARNQVDLERVASQPKEEAGKFLQDVLSKVTNH